MAQTVSQAALLLDVLTGKNVFLSAASSELPLRIGVVKQWMTSDDRVNSLFENSVHALSKFGGQVLNQ